MSVLSATLPTDAPMELLSEADGPSDQDLLSLLGALGTGPVNWASDWGRWRSKAVGIFLTAGIDPYYPRKVGERTGYTDPSRVVTASKRGIPALWA